MPDPQNPVFIDNAQNLQDYCDGLNDCEWLAIDTEFIREKTYYPQWCLLQVADPGGQIALIDTQAIDDLGPIMQRLNHPATTVILHAASQDLELFYHFQQRLPAPLFDTQIAASLTGHGDQIGYGNLVQAVLNISLEKGLARTDWSRRPLSDDELRYAADDVRHLGALYSQLSADLENRGRLGWLQPEFEALAEPNRYAPDPATSWRRVRGIGRLKPRQQQLAACLAQWREHQAMQANRPRKWILNDETLLDIARRQPRDLSDLGKLRDIGDKLLDRHGQALIEMVARSAELPTEALVDRKQRLSATQEPLVDILMGVLREQARRHQLSPAALGKRSDLEAMIAGEHDVTLLKGWRREAAGNALMDVLQNNTPVQVNDGRLQFGVEN